MDYAVPAAHGLTGRRPRQHGLAVCLLVAGVAAFAAGAITSAGQEGEPLLVPLLRAAIVGVPLGVGLYSWITGYERRFAFALALTGAVLLVSTLAESGDPTAYSVGRLAGWFVEWLVVFVILSFPAGRLPDAPDRLLVGLMGAVVGLLLLPRAFLAETFATPSPYTSCTSDCPSNAFLVVGSEPGIVESILKPAGSLAVLALMTAVLVRLWQRNHHATPFVRRVFSAVFAIGAVRVTLIGFGFSARDVESSTWFLEGVSWLIALTVPALALAFLSGLVSWRLFAGERLERLAESVGSAPNARSLESALAEAFNDPTVEVALPLNGGWVDSLGAPTSLPENGSGRAVSEVRLGGTVVAAVVHDDALEANERLIHAGTAIAALALDIQRLELEKERTIRTQRIATARIAARAEQDRRRLERDLHDGAQQRLVALGIEMELTEELVLRDPEEAARRLSKLRGQVAEALEEVRSLAHGVSPPLLADRGLVEALRGVALRSPVRVDVEARGIGALPPAVESAVYFCVLEAIQNALKHADGAHRIDIGLEVVGEDLRFVVRDDGGGAPSGRLVEGAGFKNMRERMGALGGEIEINSTVAVGTTVRGRIPLSQPDSD
jgi:signal transduction histidine kinase